jgi:hemerythrin
LEHLVWSESLSIGLDQLDDQHKKMVGILNALQEAISQGSQKPDVERVIADLLSYTRYHLSFEERQMVVAAYPGLSDHQREHRGLVAQIEIYALQVNDRQPLAAIKLLKFVNQWWSRHLATSDRAYGEFELARKAA